MQVYCLSIRFVPSTGHFVVVAQFTDDFLFSTRLLLHFAVVPKSISLLPCRISCYLLCIVMIRCLAATAPHWLMLHASQPNDQAQRDLATPQSLFLMCRLFSFQFYSIFNSFYSPPPSPGNNFYFAFQLDLFRIACSSCCMDALWEKEE